MTDEQVLKDALTCPKLSKFSNVNLPAIMAWRTTGGRILTLLEVHLHNIATRRLSRI